MANTRYDRINATRPSKFFSCHCSLLHDYHFHNLVVIGLQLPNFSLYTGCISIYQLVNLDVSFFWDEVYWFFIMHTVPSKNANASEKCVKKKKFLGLSVLTSKDIVHCKTCILPQKS